MRTIGRETVYPARQRALVLPARPAVCEIARMADPYLRSLDILVTSIIIIMGMMVGAILFYGGRRRGRARDFLVGVAWTVAIVGAVYYVART